MKTSDTPPPDAPFCDDDDDGGLRDIAYYDSPEYQRKMKERTVDLLQRLAAQNEREAIDSTVFSLEQSKAAAVENPDDFSNMLAANARILNAAFEFYLDKAHTTRAGDQKIALAIKVQGQLVRTIDTWRRLENFHQDGTK